MILVSIIVSTDYQGGRYSSILFVHTAQGWYFGSLLFWELLPMGFLLAKSEPEGVNWRINQLSFLVVVI